MWNLRDTRNRLANAKGPTCTQGYRASCSDKGASKGEEEEEGGYILASITSSVARPMRIRWSRRQWWRNRDGKVWRGGAVETVYETVEGEGRSVVRWGRVVSIEYCGNHIVVALKL